MLSGLISKKQLEISHQSKAKSSFNLREEKIEQNQTNNLQKCIRSSTKKNSAFFHLTKQINPHIEN
jgi:hypothetical protein